MYFFADFVSDNLCAERSAPVDYERCEFLRESERKYSLKCRKIEESIYRTQGLVFLVN